tara:strand:- start:479 stop:1690 length:1212 start_codon:yes stop_codon:yes gene_type:complete
MATSLKEYQYHGASFGNEGLTLKDKDGQPFIIRKDILEWGGSTVWEKCHPTFISQKRKVILTCPRKVGHSSIRFYLSYMNSHYDDDWTWIEGIDRDPQQWLSDEDSEALYQDLYSDNPENSKICVVPEPDACSNTNLEGNQYHYGAQFVSKKDTEEVNRLFGKENDIMWPLEFSDNSEKILNNERAFFPPWQKLKPFSDYKTYLIVRDPWDRFISGVITEMDNGLMNPWKYDSIANTEKGWELLYTAVKRILFFTEPEYLTLGGLDGPQANHTFLLGRPLWKGESMYDSYDVLIDFKHELEFESNEHEIMSVSHDSLKNSKGIIDSLLHYGFINQEVVDEFYGKQHHSMYAHTHINVTPYIRQHVISELQEDKDLKEWWDRARELVDIEYKLIENNKHKIEKT